MNKSNSPSGSDEMVSAEQTEYDFRFVTKNAQSFDSAWITIQFRDMRAIPWDEVRKVQPLMKQFTEAFPMEMGSIGNSYSPWITGKCISDLGRKWRDADLAKKSEASDEPK